jgi:hypothetical protein
MNEITQSDLQLIVDALGMQSARLRRRSRSRGYSGDTLASARKYLRDRADRSAELAQIFARPAAANDLATRAMDIIDKAVSDGILPG